MSIFEKKPVDNKWEEAKRIVLNDKGTLDGNHPLVIQIYEDIKKSDMDKSASFSPYFLAGIEIGMEKKSEVVAHVAGPSGSGKTTLLDKIKHINPGLVVKDLDDFDNDARKLPQFSGKKRDWDNIKLENLAKHRQAEVDRFISDNKDKSIVFGGHHIEGQNTINFPAENRYLLNTGALLSAWRRRRRSKGSANERTLGDFIKDYREGRDDISKLKSLGYSETDGKSILESLRSRGQ